MKIKKQLLLLLLECLSINAVAMEKAKITEKEFDKEQRILRDKHYYTKQIDEILFNEQLTNLFIQAIDSGIATPSTITTIDSKFDIFGYALYHNNDALVTYCLEQKHSPDAPILRYNKKVIPLIVASSHFWPLFKKYNANFNVIIKDENYGTLLHKFIDSDYNNEIEWLLKETTIDINQPNGDGNTAGHKLSGIFYIGNTQNGKKTFKMLAECGIDPFQKNNDNKTPKEIAAKTALDYQKEFSKNPHGINLKEFHSNALKMLSLWEKYEREYQQNNIAKSVKNHCYCENFIHLNEPNILLEFPEFSLEQIQNACRFFPEDSQIGSFCKKNPEKSDCIMIVQHYIRFNDVYHTIKKRNENWAQCRLLEQEKKSLYEKLHAAKTNRYSIPFEKIFPFLEQEIQEKFKIKNQLSLEEEFDLDEKIDKAQDDMFGITKLKNQLDTIDKELEQLRAEPVWKKEKKARKKIYGYYSALDFAVCSGKSSYHRSIKNLLAMLSDDELKCKEAAKINEGLHNAYRNKKQS